MKLNVLEFVTNVILILFNSVKFKLKKGAISLICNLGWTLIIIAAFRSDNKVKIDVYVLSGKAKLYCVVILLIVFIV